MDLHEPFESDDPNGENIIWSEAAKAESYRSSIEVYQIRDEDGSLLGFMKFIIEGDDIITKSFS